MARNSGIIIFTALSLAGCVGNSLQTTQGIIEDGWAKAPPPYDPDPVYCYKTIGAVDCHERPVARDQRRLVNYYGTKSGEPEIAAPEIDSDNPIQMQKLPTSDSSER